jgi:hypothetical protein
MRAMGEWRLWTIWIFTLSLCVILVVGAFHPGHWNSRDVTKQLANARVEIEWLLSRL